MGDRHWTITYLANITYRITIIRCVFMSQNGQKCLDGWGSVPDSTTGAHSAPKPQNSTKGRSKGRENRGGESRKEVGKVKEGREGKGKDWRAEGDRREGNGCAPSCSSSIHQ